MNRYNVLEARLACASALGEHLPGPYRWKLNAWLLGVPEAKGAEKVSRIKASGRWAHDLGFVDAVIRQVYRAWRASAADRAWMEDNEPW